MSKPAAKAAAKSTSGPSYESMIKEAILAHPEEARFGLSRQTIKKVVHSKFPATAKLSEAAFNKHISSAIAKGAEKKTFTLPKGPSGKVKLSAPAKKVTAKKPAAKKPAAKKPAAKKPAAKKPAAKKAAAPASATAPATAKKPAAAKKTKSSTAVKAKKPVAKKTAPKKAAAPKKKAAAPKKA